MTAWIALHLYSNLYLVDSAKLFNKHVNFENLRNSILLLFWHPFPSTRCLTISLNASLLLCITVAVCLSLPSSRPSLHPCLILPSFFSIHQFLPWSVFMVNLIGRCCWTASPKPLRLSSTRRRWQERSFADSPILQRRYTGLVTPTHQKLCLTLRRYSTRHMQSVSRLTWTLHFMQCVWRFIGDFPTKCDGPFHEYFCNEIKFTTKIVDVVI